MPIKQSHILLVATLIVITILLISYLSIAPHIRLMADDYCLAADGREMGAVETVINTYNTWSGRYVTYFLVSWMGTVSVSAFSILPLVLILTWVIVASFLANQILLFLKMPDGVAYSLVLGSVFVLGILTTMPQVQQSVFWASGSASYGLPIVALTAYLGFMLHIFRKQLTGKRWVQVLVFIFPLISAGFSETYAILQPTLFVVALLGVRFFVPQQFRRRMYPILLIGFVASVIGLLILIAAPGNAVRRSRFAEETETQSLIDYLFVFVQPPLFYLLNVRASAILFCSFVISGGLFYFQYPLTYKPRTIATPTIPRLMVFFMFILQALLLLLLVFGVGGGAIDPNANPLIENLGGVDRIVELVASVALMTVFWGWLMVRRRQLNRAIITMRAPEHYYLALLFIGIILLVLLMILPLQFFTRFYLFANWMIIGVLWFVQMINIPIESDVWRPSAWVLVTGILAIALIMVVFFPAVLATGEIAEGRVWSFSALMRVSVSMVWGAILGVILKAIMPIDVILQSRRYSLLSLAACVALALIPLNVSLDNFATSNELIQYSRAWDARAEQIAQVQENGEVSIVVEPLPFNAEDWAFLDKPGSEPEKNTCVARFFELESFVVLSDSN